MKAIIVVPMTKAEAQECVNRIKGRIENIRRNLIELYEREGWKALGYASWRECVIREFGQSEAYLYRQLAAARIEANLSPTGEIGKLPERQVRPLTALPPEKQREAWKQVVERYPGQVTSERVQEVVDEMRGRNGDAEYAAFEREQLLPQLHDAGIERSPQILSGQEGELDEVPPEQKERAANRLRKAVIELIEGVDVHDERAVEECADEMMRTIGLRYDSIAVAVRIGIELSSGPKTLSDLTRLCIWACGRSADGMKRDDYLSWRKKTLRILDAISLSNGCGLYEHTLDSGQLVYSLLPPKGES